MTPELLAELGTAEGRRVLAAAAELADRDPLTAATSLRASGVRPALAAAALTQAELRARGTGKFGPDAERMFFTHDGLEQATRAVIAERRASRLVAAGVGRLVDLCCGIGADALAAARAGILVQAVDHDPVTAAVAAANATALGLADRISVHCRTAASTDLHGADAVFCDPARRRGDARVFDPESYSPPWSYLTGLVDAVPRTVLKLAPGIEHSLIPAGAEAEWVSVDGHVAEAAFWCGPLAEVPRRATVLRSTGTAAVLTGTGLVQAAAGPVRGYLYVPDGAVVRSHLVAEFAGTVAGNLADPSIAYVYSDTWLPTPFARGYQILEILPSSVKRLRAALRARDVGSLTVKKRGTALDPQWFRAQMRLTGQQPATVVLTRVAGSPAALLVRPLPAG